MRCSLLRPTPSSRTGSSRGLTRTSCSRAFAKDFVDQGGNLDKSIGTGRLLEEVSRLDAEGNPVETITRNISGPGVQTFDENGSTLTGLGPWLLFGFPGEFTGFPDGFIWFTTGQFVLRFEGTDPITMVKEPRHEDVCELLG